MRITRKARKQAAIKRNSQNTSKARRRLVENYRCEAGIACSEQEVSKIDHESIDKHTENLKSENEDLRKQCDALVRKLEEKELEMANLKRQGYKGCYGKRTKAGSPTETA